MRLVLALTVPFVLAAAGGCGAGSPAAQCHVNADCASGLCTPAGTCATARDAGIVAGDGSTPRDGGGACVPNHDGRIDRGEVVLAAGETEKLLVAENAPVDTAGTVQSDGTRLWDLSGSLSGDHTLTITTQAPGGQWWSADFSGATFAARLSDTSDLLGVFQAGDTALSLLGVVSPDGGSSRTELSYAPPYTALSFPLMVGASWSTTSTVSGLASGVAAGYDDAYSSSVDESGTLKTPYGSFPVLRVRTVLTRTAGFTVTVIRTYQFVAECYGVVATIVSEPDEPNAEFTTAAEVQRITP